jgi:hypothetical protein
MVDAKLLLSDLQEQVGVGRIELEFPRRPPRRAGGYDGGAGRVAAGRLATVGQKRGIRYLLP